MRTTDTMPSQQNQPFSAAVACGKRCDFASLRPICPHDAHKTAPLAVDLFCGKGGWAHGLMAAGWRCCGYDIADMGGYPGELRLADVLTLNGAEFADAGLIVASPPCQEYSYMAMPWTRAKQIARALRGQDDFPEGYSGSRTIDDLNRLFNASFRIQREASAAAGRHVPMVVENVRGAIPWVGRSAWNYGSFHLWGDVPALMPITRKRGGKRNPDGSSHVGSWFAVPDSMRGSKGTKPYADRGWTAGVAASLGLEQRCQKTTAHLHLRDGHGHSRHLTNQAEHDRARTGVKQGGTWWHDPGSISRISGSKSSARKEATALIAMIPFPLARHIGECYYPAHKIGGAR